MTKITRQKIFEKIYQLDEYLSNLKQLRNEIQSQEQFLSDFRLYGLAERYLQLCCQSIIDVSHLIIIEEGINKPESQKEIFSAIYEKKIISKELFPHLKGLTGFRNILVHEYGKIDRKKIYQYLMKRLGDIESFRKEILAFLKKQS
ncbi:MAG: DUF86 domain-containing protein [Candidatus Aminicenantes bacterium]|nr:DUF86 domain-containing protein [Candidatus Aminicenantes bacterium]